MKKVFLYIMAFFYVLVGIAHLFKPEFFLLIMPFWLPFKIPLIYTSGILEIVLALMLLSKRTQSMAATLIMVMLTIYLFIIHIPQSIDFYQKGNHYLIASIVRIPVQFLLLVWAQIYTNCERKEELLQSTF